MRHATQLRLLPGDRLLISTDGITEAKNAEGDYFGTDRLKAVAADGIVCLLDEVERFCGDKPLHDDCTALELLYHG